MTLFILGGIMSAFFSTGCNVNDSHSKSGRSVRPVTIVALGDSLTEGYGVQNIQSYPALLEKKLQNEGIACKVINAGISGETSGGLLSRLNRILSLKPDIVILCTGANDGLLGMEVSRIQDNITQIVHKLKENQITVILAGMKMLIDVGSNYSETYDRLYVEIAEKEHLIFLPFFLESVAGNPDLNQFDGIHPTAAGYRVISEAVYPYVLKAVKAHRRQE
jgi:acyl-CoA thioesterase I